MSIDELLNIGKTVAMIGGLATFFFFYFRNPGFQKQVKQVLRFLPAVATWVAGLVPDKKGEFDTHDYLIVLGKVAVKLQETIEDPANKSFEDIQDDVLSILRSELAAYEGMPGVPSVDDASLQIQIRVIFEGIQRATSEDSTGNDS